MCVQKNCQVEQFSFCGNACFGFTRLNAKKKLLGVTICLLHAFIAKKKYTDYNVHVVTSGCSQTSAGEEVGGSMVGINRLNVPAIDSFSH